MPQPDRNKKETIVRDQHWKTRKPTWGGGSSAISCVSDPHFRLRSPKVKIKVSVFSGGVKVIVYAVVPVSALKISCAQDMILEKTKIQQVKFAEGTMILEKSNH